MWKSRYTRGPHEGTDFVNMIAEDFGRIQISCWLESETFLACKRWGMDGERTVAIVPFGTKAQLVPQSTRLDTFEIELFACEVGPEGSRPESFPRFCRGGPVCQSHSRLCLARFPAPSKVTQNQAPSVLTILKIKRPWKFHSDQIVDCDGRSRAARWTWNAHGHEPVLLHGAMVLQHQGNEFVIACRTRGKVLRRVGRPLDFSNYTKPPNWIPLKPKTSNTNLSSAIRGLQKEMQNLNQNAGGLFTATLAQGQFEVEPEPRGGYYRHVSIGERSNVILGDGSIERVGTDDQSHPRTPGHDLEAATRGIRQHMGQPILRPGEQADEITESTN